jgi:ureidoacrylate peracid hydrolase
MSFPTFEEWSATVESVDVPFADTAVLVVDMQNLMLSDHSTLNDAGIDTRALRPSIPGVQRLLASARASGHPVIFIRIKNMPEESLEHSSHSRLHGYESTDTTVKASTEYDDDWAAEIIPELDVEETDYLLDKPFGSAFVASRLEPLLEGLGIKNLVVCGTTTNMCVENSARHAAEHGFGTYVVRDAVGEFEESRGAHSLYAIDTTVGRVVTNDDVARSWLVEPVMADVESEPLGAAV